MPLPSNAELRETNDALKSKVQELKEAHSKDQDTIAQMMAKIDALTVENAALQQNNSQNEDVQDALQVQRPVPVSVPNTSSSQPPVSVPNTSSSQPPVSVPNTSSSQPPVKAQKIPLPPMEKFDGQSSSVTEWWITFMSFVTLHQMPEASAITALPFYLTGIAQQWFLHLAPQFKVSLNKVGEAFFKRFKPKEPINKEVLRVNQAPGETVDQYLFRVRRLAADSTMDENLVTFFALEGLLAKLRTIVVPQQPQSLEELREQANLAETAVRHKPMDAPTMNIAAAVQEGIKAAAGTIKETVEATVDDRLGHFGRRTNGPDRTRHRPQRAQANSDSTNVCYRCGATSNQLIAAKCLVKVHKRKAIMKVLNPTYSNVRLRKRQVIATVEEIQADEIIPLTDSESLHSPEISAIETGQDETHKNELNFDLSESDLSDKQKENLLEFLHQHKDVFSTDLSQIGKTSLYKHKIDTVPGAKPVRKQFYRTSPTASQVIREHVNEMLQNDIIQPSNSEWHSPVVLVKKKNGQTRFACDYRALNKITIPMSFPLPHIETVFDSIGDAKAKIFTNLDFKSAFWQVEMSPCSKHKAAFITQDGVYEWKRMPFGLMNAPISFQTLMSGVLRDLNFKSVLVYIDDVLIYSKDYKSHIKDLSLVFQKLKQAGLTLEPSKCNFAVKQLKFLGHIISKNGVEVDPEKTRIVSEFPAPKKQKQVRSFLGMANYYRRFIPNFAKIASPLYDLLKKDKAFQWTDECQQSFEKLKSALLSAPILSYPDPVRNFVLTCDASNLAIGFYLSQMSTSNQEHVIAYGGKALSKEERNYTTSEKELLAVVKGVEAYRPYLVGKKFTVYTDHRALVWLKSAKHTGRLERWALRLQEYDFDIVHRPGKNNHVADALSRVPYQDEDEVSNPESRSIQQVSAIETSQIISDTPEGIQVNLYYTPDETEIVALDPGQYDILPGKQKDLFQLQKECPDFHEIIQYLQDQKLPDDGKRRDKIIAESKHYGIVDGILVHFYQRRCKRQPTEFRYIKQVAMPKVLRQEALKQYHDSIAGGGHLGIEKVSTAMVQMYHWPHMHQDIVNYVRSCIRCQQAKRDSNPARPPLTPLPRRDRFDCWQIDILGPIHKSPEGYEYILLCIEAHSRWPEAIPLKTQSATEVATALFANIISRYGAPSILFSDRGRNFMSNLIGALCEIFEISRHHTSSYHPNTNGLVERQNSVIAQCLRTYCAKDQGKWPSFLPGIMMSFRKAISAHSTEYSPFYLMFGEEMRLPFDADLLPKDTLGRDAKQYLEHFLSNLKIAHVIAKKNDEYNQQRNKQYHDKHIRIPDFRIGEKVMMAIHQIPKGQSAKLYDKAMGPYVIIDCGPNYTYKLKRCSDNKVHPNLINAIHLKRYYEPNTQRQNIGPSSTSPVPGPLTTSPVPGPSSTSPVPGPSTTSPVPGPSSTSPVPGPLTTSPVPGPSTTSPVPGPSTTSPVPGPSSTSPVPGPLTTSPVPGPSTTSPVPGPSSTSPVPGPLTTSPVPGPLTTSPVPGPSSTSPVPGPSSTSPVPGPLTTSPVPGPSTTSPVPGPSSTSPVPGPSSTSPVPGPSTTSTSSKDSGSSSSLPGNKTFHIKELSGAKFKSGKRLIRVVWEDNSKTWEPDESFDPDVLDIINKIFTQKGTRRKTYFVRKTKSLFGTATIEDVQILASHVNALNSQTRNFAKAMQHTEARLSSFMTVIDKKTTNLLKASSHPASLKRSNCPKPTCRPLDCIDSKPTWKFVNGIICPWCPKCTTTCPVFECPFPPTDCDLEMKFRIIDGELCPTCMDCI
ncbi:hypothetical protein FSP39_002098 [Pinctada imbricata]|uniref:Reverse transcriptase n=1 Tax=Pinctada imbricata TaxID=66713 RepID=A0AA89C9M0_PINIB|nr:hypothetical protein FSP39_002098 [Pinctada imbricata]